MIFGTKDILINNIAYILRRVPVFGIPGSGSYRLRPVAVEDVADICVQSGATRTDEVIDAVGPETFTFEDLVRLIARTSVAACSSCMFRRPWRCARGRLSARWSVMSS